MNPVNFPESNSRFGPPSDLVESQCKTIFAFKGQLTKGSIDGSQVVVTAWKPEPWEIERLKNGGSIFLTCIGGLPPHCITTSFEEATNFA